jgi:hypothetical protein
MGGYRTGAHDPDDSYGRGILHSTDPSQVSGGISSPGAQKSNDLRSEILCHFFTPRISNVKAQMSNQIQSPNIKNF